MGVHRCLSVMASARYSYFLLESVGGASVTDPTSLLIGSSAVIGRARERSRLAFGWTGCASCSTASLRTRTTFPTLTAGSLPSAMKRRTVVVLTLRASAVSSTVSSSISSISYPLLSFNPSTSSVAEARRSRPLRVAALQSPGAAPTNMSVELRGGHLRGCPRSTRTVSAYRGPGCPPIQHSVVGSRRAARSVARKLLQPAGGSQAREHYGWREPCDSG